MVRNLVNREPDNNGELLGQHNGLDVVRVAHKFPTEGIKTGRLAKLERELLSLRNIYAEKVAVAKPDELLNIARRGNDIKKMIKNLREDFDVDCAYFANYKMPRNKFIENWAGHYDVGLPNYKVEVYELNTGRRYYVQF